MRILRNALIGLTLLGVSAAPLLWWLPARWVMPRIEPQLHGLHLQQVHGSLWNGRADEVTTLDGKRLGRLQWQLSRRALLGQLRLRLADDVEGIITRVRHGQPLAAHMNFALPELVQLPGWPENYRLKVFTGAEK